MSSPERRSVLGRPHRAEAPPTRRKPDVPPDMPKAGAPAKPRGKPELFSIDLEQRLWDHKMPFEPPRSSVVVPQRQLVGGVLERAAPASSSSISSSATCSGASPRL